MILLRKLRKERRMSQWELGLWACVSAGTVSNVERGKSAPSAYMLKAFGEGLGYEGRPENLLSEVEG